MTVRSPIQIVIEISFTLTLSVMLEYSTVQSELQFA